MQHRFHTNELLLLICVIRLEDFLRVRKFEKYSILDTLLIQETLTVPLACELASQLGFPLVSLGCILTASNEGGGCSTGLMQEESPFLSSLICILELKFLRQGSCTFNLSNPITSGSTTSIGVSSYPISLASISLLDFKTSSKDFVLGIFP